MNEPVKAEGFIWLIVGVFWVIAQIAGAAAKKNQPRPPVSGNEEGNRPSEDPLAELLRKMAGIEELRTEPPRSVELPKEKVFTPPPRHSEVRTKSPWKPGDIEALPDIAPLRRAAPEPAAPAPVPPKVDVRPKMSAFRNSIPSIKMPTMNLSFQGSGTVVPKAQNLGNILSLSDKNSVRRAMLSHIIFSPPKALERSGN